jgi:hypothetical protein
MAMTMCRSDRVLIAVNDEQPLTNDEWDSWISLCLERAGKDARAYVETRGQGGPNAKQRKRLVDVQQKVDIRFAIASDSLVVRGIVTAVAWLGVPLRAIEPDDYTAAAEFLELSASELGRVVDTLPRLRQACVKRGR